MRVVVEAAHAVKKERKIIKPNIWGILRRQTSTNERKYISDWITPKEVETWIPGDIVMILANTGRGKSYFVKNNLRSILKKRGQKCLYLLSRVRTKEQFEAELPADETIKFMTYQAVESIKADPFSSLGSWDVIVADECHYFLSDSSFNSSTDISFDWVMGQEKAIRIFMTATGDGIEEYFNDRLIMFTQYRIDSNYNQIRNLNFFWHESQLAVLADQIIASGHAGDELLHKPQL